jgi:hypothetical protein
MPEPLSRVKIQAPCVAPAFPIDEAEQAQLREAARGAAQSCGWTGAKCGNKPREHFQKSARKLADLERELAGLKSEEPSEDLQWMYDNLRLVRADVQDLDGAAANILGKLPGIRTQTDECLPRPVALARALIQVCNFRLTEGHFFYFVQAVEEVEPLRLSELGAMLPGLKMALLELIADRGWKALEAFKSEGAKAPSFGLGRLIRSLRFVGEIDWKETLEQLSIVHRLLCLDPVGVYGRMDFESREQYRLRVANIAAHSDVGEADVARIAVRFAENAIVDRDAPEALRDRLRHVGYYLLDRTGSAALLHEVNYSASLGGWIQRLFRNNPDEVYIIGIEFVTLITVVVLIMMVVKTQGGWGLILGALLLILPATQAAVEVMNYLVTTVLTPRALPKIDYSKGVAPESATMVAIPTLLINEKQIRGLVDDLEVRYLVNRDPNICYALLTDLPDTAEPAQEQDARIDLTISLIEALNRKYADEPYGGFYLFHRHRVYNPREGAWMGWERKRGKLLDLNQLLRKVFDPFPVKAGDMKRLPTIRYVLTLDSDTQLPRGTAQRMIGAMAHPLNRPVVDPELRIVTDGYGILQPRVGISVHSATRSRLASIYSGQTGYDIYSRAVSDVYQDLYGEGIFTGKGIYDVDALREVLEHRFPRNALLSHDLIEGAYARAGLVSDIEVIDDYPSHYSAYNRRKHRWLRGDWQIVRWIFNKVPDESRKQVDNPITLVSRWKIVDNLRRSLMEPATFFLLIAGWFFLPAGPRFWTLVTLGLLFLPIYFRLLFALINSVSHANWGGVRDAFKDLITSHVSILLNIAFLAHQALFAVDAIVRTIIRSTITHRSMLEWETATEAELGLRSRTPVDIYLDWVPAVGIALAVALYWRPEAAPYALPFIIAWCFSKAISIWINRSPQLEEYKLTDDEHKFLREVALRTWHYYVTYSNEGNHWLIPDNVQVEPYKVAERISPTNLGFLLNARQAAVEFGFLTLSEFEDYTAKTLATVESLPKFMGHPANWYDTLTLRPLEPVFVSSVDSGNLVASLWSMKQGCLSYLRQPLIRATAWQGLEDHYHAAGMKLNLHTITPRPATDEDIVWLPKLLAASLPPAPERSSPEAGPGVDWPVETSKRVAALREEVRRYMPWNLPEYEAVRALSSEIFSLPKGLLIPAKANAYYDELERNLQTAAAHGSVTDGVRAAIDTLRREIPACRIQMSALVDGVQRIADQCDELVHQMSFIDLTDKRRNLLSIGYNATKGELEKSCYDLLASEARIATFVAVAKGDAPQETWFRLGRGHTFAEGEAVLVSWTGTMFEYMMPVIWMKSQPNTLLDRAVQSAVRVQQKYATRHGVPWGISESAFAKTDPDGTYGYAAFGVPSLALNVERAGALVVSPYSSCLASMVDSAAAVQNLKGMARRKWLSDFGFFESADFTSYPEKKRFKSRKYDLVRCWMAHHQGMSLTALCNLFFDDPFQRWFHAEPMVQASELILQERPLRVKPLTESAPRRVISFTRKVITGRTPDRMRASA